MIAQIQAMAAALETIPGYGQRVLWRDLPTEESPAEQIYLSRPLSADRLSDGSARWDLTWVAIVPADPLTMVEAQYAAQSAMRTALMAADTCGAWRIGRGPIGPRAEGSNTGTAAVTVSIIIREGE